MIGFEIDFDAVVVATSTSSSGSSLSSRSSLSATKVILSGAFTLTSAGPRHLTHGTVTSALQIAVREDVVVVILGQFSAKVAGGGVEIGVHPLQRIGEERAGEVQLDEHPLARYVLDFIAHTRKKDGSL